MSRGRLIQCSSLLIVGSFVCWFFPLVHVQPLDGGNTSGVSVELTNETPANGTSANGEPRNLAAYATGTEITQFWNALDADATAARTQYGRQAGLGGAWYFRIRGRGIVEIVEKDRVVLSVVDSSRRVCLELGVMVDNTVREAIGVKASDFANSQDFNAVSSELNRRVEQDVIAPNRALLKEGVVVDFIGCTRIGGKSDLDPLCLIPIQLKTRASERGAGVESDDSLKRYSGATEAHPTGSTP